MIIEFKLINMIKHNYCHDRTPFVSTFIGKLILYKANYMYFNRASIVTCEMLVCGLNYYYCVFLSEFDYFEQTSVIKYCIIRLGKSSLFNI